MNGRVCREECASVARGSADVRASSSRLRRVTDTLAGEMRQHMQEPFPDAVERGLDYGEVDAVMIDADIYGWATRAGSLSKLDQSRLLRATDELQRSIAAFPPEARPYYERLLRIARLTLAV